MAKKQTPAPPPRPPTPQQESPSSKEEEQEEEEYEEYEEIEVEEEVEVEVEEEEEEEEEVEEVENQEEAEVENREDGVRKEEGQEEKDEAAKLTRDSIRELLEPFGKDQLISLLKEAAHDDPDLAARLAASADSDPAHRKIFVHGLPWDATSDVLIAAFRQYGDIEECKAVADKVTGKSKGYGFVLFRTREGAQKALREPQKKIGSRVASCQLASAGPVQGGWGSGSHSVKNYLGTAGAAQSAPLGAGSGAAVLQPNDLALAYTTASLMGINPAAAGLLGQNAFPGAIGLVGQGLALPTAGVSPAFNWAGGTTTQAYESALGFGGAVPGINAVNPSVIGSYGFQAALHGLGALQGSQLPSAGMQSQAGLGSFGGNMPQYLGR